MILHFPYFDKVIKFVKTKEVKIFWGEFYIITVGSHWVIRSLFEKTKSEADIDVDELPNTSDVLLYSILESLMKESFKLMKPSAYLLNLGRGGIVNEADLAAALDTAQIAGAGLDVFEHEPINKHNPLLSLKNPERLLASPHIAWASQEARQRLAVEVVQNIQAFKRGEARNRVV